MLLDTASANPLETAIILDTDDFALVAECETGGIRWTVDLAADGVFLYLLACYS